MASTFSPNIQLEEPARGDQVGVWDTVVNGNMTLLDLVVGGQTAITLNNTPVVLSAAQFQAKTITFQSTLTGSVAITFSSTFKKSYEIQNACTGSSAFVITLGTTVAGGQVVCCPPGEIVEVLNDGTNIKFKNFDRVGSYWDYAGSSVPAWVTGCSVPPYLDCNGGAFSAVTYPQLAVILSGTTLPDARGRAPYYLNAGTGRLTSAGAGIDGNTVRAAGGTNGLVLSAAYIPTLTSVNAAQAITVTPSGGANIWTNAIPGSVPATGGAQLLPEGGSNGGNYPMTGNNSISVAYTNASPTTIQVPAQGFVAGLRLIRAA